MRHKSYRPIQKVHLVLRHLDGRVLGVYTKRAKAEEEQAKQLGDGGFITSVLEFKLTYGEY